MESSTLYAFLTLAVGLTIVVGGIVVIRLNAFLALISAAMVVSMMAPGEWDEKTSRVADAFGGTAAGIGIVIALAAVIGRAMMDSGAADRIVRFFLDMLGEKRSSAALTASAFTLAIPVFFDTVFYLMVPLARSMYRQTGRNYLKYLGAVACAAIAHALIPPTPGPLIVADALDVDLGTTILVGIVVAIPAAVAGLAFAGWIDRRMPIEMRPLEGDEPGPATLAVTELPSLTLSLAPVLLPLALITSNTVTTSVVEAFYGDTPTATASQLVAVTSLVGNPNFALLLSAGIALATLVRHRQPTRDKLSKSVEQALMSGGVIILITAAGGAFGGMLKLAGLAEAISDLFGESSARGIPLLLLAFGVASLLKFAQGSTTASMVVTSQMFKAMIDPATLGYHPVYLAMAIGGGGLVGSWMNDSGFWIFARMGGLTEVETLKSWTPLLVILGIVSLGMTLLLVVLFPMPLSP
jgi:GntP family gluconate:H+ symporter